MAEKVKTVIECYFQLPDFILADTLGPSVGSCGFQVLRGVEFIWSALSPLIITMRIHTTNPRVILQDNANRSNLRINVIIVGVALSILFIAAAVFFYKHSKKCIKVSLTVRLRYNPTRNLTAWSKMVKHTDIMHIRHASRIFLYFGDAFRHQKFIRNAKISNFRYRKFCKFYFRFSWISWKDAEFNFRGFSRSEYVLRFNGQCLTFVAKNGQLVGWLLIQQKGCNQPNRVNYTVVPGEPIVIRILTDFVLKERRQSQKDQQDLVAKMTSEGHKMDPTEFEEKSNFVLSKTPAGKLEFSPSRFLRFLL